MVLNGPRNSGKLDFCHKIVRRQLEYYRDCLIKGYLGYSDLKLECLVLARGVKWSETILRLDSFEQQVGDLIATLTNRKLVEDDKVQVKEQMSDVEASAIVIELRKIKHKEVRRDLIQNQSLLSPASDKVAGTSIVMYEKLAKQSQAGNSQVEE